MMYQMVCLDLDGTLLNRSRAVSMENRKALIDCLDRGIYIYLVTGRPPCFARWLTRQIDPPYPGDLQQWRLVSARFKGRSASPVFAGRAVPA